MSKELIDSELMRAFDLWSQAADVEFEQIIDIDRPTFNDLLLMNKTQKTSKEELADIDVRFETGYHGDSEPFDGSGLILGLQESVFRNIFYFYYKMFFFQGHAYFPEFGGSTHFDADELWTSRSSEGVNLYQVAVHEFGHALGLEHSDNFDAIMAPFFRFLIFFYSFGKKFLKSI